MADAATSGLAGERKSLAAYLGDFSADATLAARAVRIEDCAGGGGFGVRHSIRGVARQGPRDERYEAVLTRTPEGWTGHCSCVTGYRCAHLHALGAQWLARAISAAAPAVAPAVASTARVEPPRPVAAEFRLQPLEFRPVLKLWIHGEAGRGEATLRAVLRARCASPACGQEWSGGEGWRWSPLGPPRPAAEGVHYRLDLAAAKAVGARFGDFRFMWWEGDECWARPVTRNFPREFMAWHATLPPGVEIQASPELQGLVGGPVRARLAVEARAAEGAGRDWFDLSVQLKAEDKTLTPAELQMLVKARGEWVWLPTRGWRRLETEKVVTAEAGAALERLGLAADVDALSGRKRTHRFHVLQMANVPVGDAALAERLRARAAELKAVASPGLPVGLKADPRPYQVEGFRFLAHLTTHGLGGVLADDMGLGKTLQTLAWLLWLDGRGRAEGRGLRALVVAPKSVVPNWGIEAGKFAPGLTTARLEAGAQVPGEGKANVVVINYAQLRLRAAELAAEEWDAVVLDEGQNIKNPGSATARAARELRARHRVVLSGTPIENRLLDLWSLMAFAQPGLLGPQAEFQRLYDDKEDPVGARARLAARVRPFLLRRTKGQVAKDLPARIEKEVSCELEGVQRALYDAELKRARQMLDRAGGARGLDAERFNILGSLMRLRQICCDPRLLGLESAAADDGEPKGDGAPRPTSAKLEALFDAIEPLVAEGHRVLVFSQFVRMLELIREELGARGIGHLLLTGQTEGRQALVSRFQSADGPPVFLLSLKAAGAGLNLTAASYVVLFDPWWNPAVEAQAIDRTHRIGQANTVIAYRLIAKDTVEEKIRALQREKADLASDVVQEESLAKVMDIESLRRILG